MNPFALAFSVVCPLFLMMALGFLLRRVGLFTEDFLAQLNKVCFQAFLPTLLFINVYDSDFSASFQPDLILFSVLCAFALFAVLMLVVPRLEKDDRRRGVLIQGMFRSNFILFGLPMAEALYGTGGAGTAAVLIAFVVPLFNLLSVVTLEYFHSGKVSGKRIVKGVITNPIILGALVAFLFMFAGIRLPAVLEKTVRDLSRIVTPLLLILLGGTFTFSRLRPNLKHIAAAVGGRLILVPFCFLAISVALGFRGTALNALLAMFASPTAVSSFTMAQQMEADHELAGQIVVVSSLCSIVTMFVWISVLVQFGLMTAS